MSKKIGFLGKAINLSFKATLFSFQENFEWSKSVAYWQGYKIQIPSLSFISSMDYFELLRVVESRSAGSQTQMFSALLA